MTSPASPAEFSFDLYPGLDTALTAAYERNVNNGAVTPEAAATAGLAAVVKEALEQPTFGQNLSPEAAHWAETDLTSAADAWRPYQSLLSDPLPNSTELVSSGPLGAEVQRLYEVKTSLQAAGFQTPEGLNVGETMHLRVMPWQSFRNNLDRLPAWIKELRRIQNVTEFDDFLNEDLVAALQSDQKIYRNPMSTILRGSSGTTEPAWISAREYLDQRIAMDGPYGAVLVQTSNEAGCRDYVGKSPDKLTDSGQEHFKLQQHEVDGMGVFEWLALTFQEDPRKLSTQDYSWLLANRIKGSGGSGLVPYGDCYAVQVESYLDQADRRGDRIRPRLAVL